MNDRSDSRDVPRCRLLVVVGGTADPGRATLAAQGLISRNEITELTSEHDARVLDFSALRPDDAGRIPRLLVRLVEASGRSSEALSVLSFVQSRDVDIVYFTGEDVGTLAAILHRLAFWRKQRLVMRLEDASRGNGRLGRLIYSLLLAAALPGLDRVLPRTDAFTPRLRRLSRRARIVVVQQEIDDDFYSPNTIVDRQAATVVPPAPFVLSAGLEMRDYRTLVDAVTGLPVDLIVAASSPWSKDHATFGDVPHNVTIGKYSVAEMRELYRRATAVVVSVKPTDRTCGISVIAEAWAMAKPVVAATTGLTDCVRDAGSIAVDSGHVSGLRQGLLDLLNDPEKALSIGESGRRYVDQHLRLDDFVDMIARLPT